MPPNIPAILGATMIRYLEEVDHRSYVALEKDAAIKRFVGGPSPKTDLELFRNLQQYQPTTEILAIVDISTNEFIGRCGLLECAGLAEAEIFCLLARSHWRRGIGKVVVRFLTYLAKKQGKLAVGIVHPDNEGSLALLKKLDWIADGKVIKLGKQYGHLRFVGPGSSYDRK